MHRSSSTCTHTSSDAEAGLTDDHGIPAGRYDAEYFATHCGPPYRRGDEFWEGFFGGIADGIVERFGPSTVLDAGCAIGFLVEALRDRGVDAEGIDVSEFAISQVPEALRPHVRVASVTDELPRDYDLIVCIEVFEHLTEEQAKAAAANFARHTDRVLFSSTPDDSDEETHVNVQPREYWLELFAEHGFSYDPGLDARFVIPHAMALRRTDRGQFSVEVEAFVRASRELHAELAAAAVRKEAELRDLRHALTIAQPEAAQWRELQHRRGWRIYTSLDGMRIRIVPPGSFRDKALRALLRFLAARLRHVARPPAETARPAPDPETGAVLFLSACPGDAFRYRCEHQVAQQRLAGGTAHCQLVESTDLGSVVDCYEAFVLHRVPWDDEIAAFVDQARASGKPVIFDTDDLVFELDAVPFVAAISGTHQAGRASTIDGVTRFRRTLVELGAATVSTEYLREAAAGFAPAVVVTPNAVSDEMVRRADELLARRPARTSEAVVIGYLSGTPTHDRDFLEAADAVLWALETYTNVSLMTVGHLRLDERFDAFEDRVERRPFVPWRDLPEVLARVDINLAPLQPGNPFTEAKSCLKYFEAGLLGVPTIASARRDFAQAISQGVNGLLAETGDEWREALQLLVTAPTRRAEIGLAAQLDIRSTHTVRARARPMHSALASLLGGSREGPLTVNWVLPAPIAEPAAGHRTVFHLADALGARGHQVQVYVEASAHLAGLSEPEVIAFVRNEFGPLSIEVVVGHDAITPADVSIATSPATASIVSTHESSLFRAYFVQDSDPAFLEESDPLRLEAESTFDLPLRHVTWGRALAERLAQRTGLPADSVHFAVDWETTVDQFEEILRDLAYVRLRKPSHE